MARLAIPTPVKDHVWLIDEPRVNQWLKWLEVPTESFHVRIEVFLGGEFEFTNESCGHGDELVTETVTCRRQTDHWAEWLPVRSLLNHLKPASEHPLTSALLLWVETPLDGSTVAFICYYSTVTAYYESLDYLPALSDCHLFGRSTDNSKAKLNFIWSFQR